MSDWSFSLAIPGGVLAAVLLGLVLAAAAGATWFELRREPRKNRRLTLAALRVATALLVWAVAVQPRWIAERFEETEGSLAVLVDASRSMSLPRGDDSRNERARALIERWAEERGRPVAAFTFGDQLRGADLARLADVLPQDADESRLGAALEELATQEAGRDLGAPWWSSATARTGAASIRRVSRARGSASTPWRSRKTTCATTPSPRCRRTRSAFCAGRPACGWWCARSAVTAGPSRSRSGAAKRSSARSSPTCRRTARPRWRSPSRRPGSGARSTASPSRGCPRTPSPRTTSGRSWCGSPATSCACSWWPVSRAGTSATCGPSSSAIRPRTSSPSSSCGTPAISRWRGRTSWR